MHLGIHQQFVHNEPIYQRKGVEAQRLCPWHHAPILRMAAVGHSQLRQAILMRIKLHQHRTVLRAQPGIIDANKFGQIVQAFILAVDPQLGKDAPWSPVERSLPGNLKGQMIAKVTMIHHIGQQCPFTMSRHPKNGAWLA